jgi:hypothetical protein
VDYQSRYRLHRTACVLLVFVLPAICAGLSVLAFSLNTGTTPVGKFFGITHGDSYLLLGHGRIIWGRSPMPPTLPPNQFPIVGLHDELYAPLAVPGEERRSRELTPRDLGSPDNFESLPYYLPAIVGLVFLAAGLNYWPPRLPGNVIPSKRRGFVPIIPH